MRVERPCRLGSGHGESRVEDDDGDVFVFATREIREVGGWAEVRFMLGIHRGASHDHPCCLHDARWRVFVSGHLCMYLVLGTYLCRRYVHKYVYVPMYIRLLLISLSVLVLRRVFISKQTSSKQFI